MMQRDNNSNLLILLWTYESNHIVISSLINPFTNN